jgi:predicted GNAT family N-acyltransferase
MVSGSGYAKMRQVAVSPDRQGSGLGRELVLESEAWARRNGFAEIRLHARLNAVPFYERLGYHVEGDEFLEVGIPHFLMRKLF